VKEGNSNFSLTKHSGQGFRFRYQPGIVGGYVTLGSLSGGKKILNTIEISESLSYFSTGAALKWSPFSGNSKFWDQAHLVALVGLQRIFGQLTLTDGEVRETAESSVKWFPQVGAALHLPLGAGFWLSGGLEYSQALTEYTLFNSSIKTDSDQTSTVWGLSYAF
jgi:hypothetical protein